MGGSGYLAQMAELRTVLTWGVYVKSTDSQTDRLLVGDHRSFRVHFAAMGRSPAIS